MKRIVMLLTFVSVVCGSAALAEAYTMPFGLPSLPDARLAISDSYDTAGGDRVESIARFGTNKSREEVIALYRKATEEAGFQSYSSSDKPEYYMFAAKRGDDRLTIYYRNTSDWVEAGEAEFSIKAVFNK
ncbi:hypothetical protein [Marinicella rhabdoformis]|uniref:hypothetical protein n=1 Tax=Marinicella rhabdoformis TaxID=2580566 RepID=UPI0012AED97E|nr:hypothetical protein [Marinicella rhabdoformis]